MAFLVFAALLACSAQAADIVVFGDSWGTFGRNQFRDVMGRHGLTVDNVAIATLPTALRDAVARNPDARWVWLTIGGNDALFRMPLGVPIPTIIEDALRDTSTFLRPLFDANPNIRVVQFGYDILTFSMGPVCSILGASILPQCNGSISCQNREFSRLQFEYVEELARRFPRLDSVNLLGTMQAAAGVPNARPGSPNWDQFTPDAMMNDCIHASALGYTALFNQLYNVYFAGQIANQKLQMNITNA